jgi:hypothetical protein
VLGGLRTARGVLMLPAILRTLGGVALVSGTVLVLGYLRILREVQ